MTISSDGDLLTAIANDRVQKNFYQRQIVAAPSVNTWASFWLAGTGSATNPGSGSVPTTGKANGRICTKSTVGAIPIKNAEGGRTLHLASSNLVQETSGGTTGDIAIFDRICDVALAYNESTGAIVGCDATSRLPAGAGAMLMVEVTTTLQSTVNVFNFGYTNQAGVSGRTTPNITCISAAGQGRMVNAFLFQYLQDGDRGIRSLDSVTLVSGTGTTGVIVASLVRPLLYLGANQLTLPAARETVFDTRRLPRIYDDSCISAATILAGAVTTRVWGTINLIEG
jgi:hypothetical protein